jgi:transglutaminase-like putative cysteine protease
LPAGDAGTFATVAAMRELIAASQSNVALVRLAHEIAGGHDSLERRALKLRDWIDRHFIFVADPPQYELLTTPSEQLRQIATYGVAFGDCDDVAVLVGALARAVRLPVQFVLFAFGRSNAPFTHIFAETPTPSGAVDYDVTRPAQNIPRPSRVLRMEGSA